MLTVVLLFISICVAENPGQFFLHDPSACTPDGKTWIFEYVGFWYQDPLVCYRYLLRTESPEKPPCADFDGQSFVTDYHITLELPIMNCKADIEEFMSRLFHQPYQYLIVEHEDVIHIQFESFTYYDWNEQYASDGGQVYSLCLSNFELGTTTFSGSAILHGESESRFDDLEVPDICSVFDYRLEVSDDDSFSSISGATTEPQERYDDLGDEILPDAPPVDVEWLDSVPKRSIARSPERSPLQRHNAGLPQDFAKLARVGDDLSGHEWSPLQRHNAGLSDDEFPRSDAMDLYRRSPKGRFPREVTTFYGDETLDGGRPVIDGDYKRDGKRQGRYFGVDEFPQSYERKESDLSGGREMHRSDAMGPDAWEDVLDEWKRGQSDENGQRLKRVGDEEWREIADAYNSDNDKSPNREGRYPGRRLLES